MIYGLFSHCEGEYILHKVSENEETLKQDVEKMSSKYDSEIDWVVRPVKFSSIFKIIGEVPSYFPTSGRNKDLLTLKLDNWSESIVKSKKNFALLTKNGTIILNISKDGDADTDEYREHVKSIRSEPGFGERLSENCIEFDEFYEDGMLNA